MEYDLYIKKNMTYYYIFWSIHSRHQFLVPPYSIHSRHQFQLPAYIAQILHVNNSEARQNSS